MHFEVDFIFTCIFLYSQEALTQVGLPNVYLWECTTWAWDVGWRVLSVRVLENKWEQAHLLPGRRIWGKGSQTKESPGWCNHQWKVILVQKEEFALGRKDNDYGIVKLRMRWSYKVKAYRHIIKDNEDSPEQYLVQKTWEIHERTGNWEVAWLDICIFKRFYVCNSEK